MGIERALLFLALALLAEVAGTVGGFGSSVFFVPIANFFFDFESVLGITALFHLASNLSKLGLFRAGIDPRRPAGKISRARLDRLADAISDVLEEAIRAGGSTLKDFAAPDGELGYFAKQFQVYDREGEQCPGCDGKVRRIVQGGRSTFYCPSCQR